MPNRNYYQANKEKLKEQTKIRYPNKSIEEKEKSKEYYRNWYNNLDEDKKKQIRANAKNRYHNMNDEQMQKHKEYQKNYQKIYRAKKKQELENSKKEEDDFDKNAVLTPRKT